LSLWGLPPPNLTFIAAGQKMFRHFACQFRALKSGVLQIWKKCQNHEILRNLTLFHICNIPLLSAPKWLTNESTCFVQALIHRSSWNPAGKCWDTLHATSEPIEVEYCTSEIMGRIVRSSGIWHFFLYLQYSTSKFSKVTRPVSGKCLNTDLTASGQGKCWDTLNANLENLEVEYCGRRRKALVSG
jgi:hypothetical protein